MLDRTPLSPSQVAARIDLPIARHTELFWNPRYKNNIRPLPNSPVVLYNPDTFDIYSTRASTRYTPAPYKELWDQICLMCRTAGLDPDDASITLQWGKNSHGTKGSSVRVDLTWWDERVKADPHVDDYVALRMTFFASYDLSWSIQIKFSGLRLWCTNGCFHTDFAIRAVERHTGDIDIMKYQNAISNSRERFASSENMFQDMARKPVTGPAAMDVLAKLAWVNTPPQRKHPRYHHHSAAQITALEDHLGEYFNQIGMNKWAVYNAATGWATHFDTKGQYVKQHTVREERVARLFQSKEWADL